MYKARNSLTIWIPIIPIWYTCRHLDQDMAQYVREELEEWESAYQQTWSPIKMGHLDLRIFVNKTTHVVSESDIWDLLNPGIQGLERLNVTAPNADLTREVEWIVRASYMSGMLWTITESLGCGKCHKCGHRLWPTGYGEFCPVCHYSTRYRSHGWLDVNYGDSPCVKEMEEANDEQAGQAPHSEYCGSCTSG